MPLLDMQRKGQQIGRIRIGQRITVDGKERPVRLDTFRFTTGSRHTADAIAEFYGGDVVPWLKQWEVITTQSEIGVMVPPRDEVISQWYEMWTKGGCQRRCDSKREQISGGPCLCPADALERDKLARLTVPKACKAVTRINVMIPDLPGLGVFRLDTGSYYAAVEIADSAQLMQSARDAGAFLGAMLRIDQRERTVDGKTKKFPVPVLEVLTTLRSIVSGELAELGAAGIAAALPPAPGVKAITTGRTAAAPAPAAAAQAGGEPDNPAAGYTGMEEAQRLADRARAATEPGQVTALIQRAEAAGTLVLGDLVCTEPDHYEPLGEYLQARQRELKTASRRSRTRPAAAEQQQPALGSDWPDDWPVEGAR